MLGDSYSDQPWLGIQSDPVAASPSTPWWQSALNVVTKVVSAGKAIAPAVSSIKSQVDALKQSGASTIYAYPQSYAGGSAPIPQPTKSDNTGMIVFGVAAVIAIGAIAYVMTDSGKEKKKK